MADLEPGGTATQGDAAGAGGVAGPALPTAGQVAAHLEALDLAGLAFCAKRMLGKEPGPVVGQFTMWSRAGSRGLPSLTDPFWQALSPLRIGRPAVPQAAVCDQVLVGGERDADVARQAAADCALAGKRAFKGAPLPDLSGDERAEAQRQSALVTAVKDYWRTLGGIVGDARGAVVQGDQRAVVRLLAQRAQALGPIVQQVAVLATAVAADAGVSAEAPTADADAAAAGATPVEPVSAAESEPAVASWTEDPDDPLGGTPAVAGRPVVVGGGSLTDEQAEAFARHEQLVEEPEPEPRPVEVLSTKPVRNRIFLPIIFLLIVSGVALYVLYSIINDPTNPLLQ